MQYINSIHVCLIKINNIELDMLNIMPEVEMSVGDLAAFEGDASKALNNTYFTHVSLLGNMDETLFVTAEIGGQSLIFRESDKHLICCNRLETFTSQTLNSVSKTLSKFYPDKIITFEDIVLDEETSMSVPNFKLSFQENWCRGISPDEKYLSKRRRSVIRRRLRKLVETLKDDDVEYVFRRTQEEDIDHVIEMNAKALEAQGRRHDFPEERRRVFKQVANEIGYTAFLYADGKLIAGDVLSVIDDKAWFNIGGYDMEYRDYSPGMQLHSMIIDSCLELGVREVNFLWGNSSWKSDVGSVRTPLTTVYVASSKREFLSLGFLQHIKPSLKQTLRLKVISVLKRFGLKK